MHLSSHREPSTSVTLVAPFLLAVSLQYLLRLLVANLFPAGYSFRIADILAVERTGRQVLLTVSGSEVEYQFPLLLQDAEEAEQVLLSLSREPLPIHQT